MSGTSRSSLDGRPGRWQLARKTPIPGDGRAGHAGDQDARPRARVAALKGRTDGVDHRAVAHIARRSGQTPETVIAVLRALQDEVTLNR